MPYTLKDRDLMRNVGICQRRLNCGRLILRDQIVSVPHDVKNVSPVLPDLRRQGYGRFGLAERNVGIGDPSTINRNR